MFLGVPSGRPLMLLSRDSIFVHSGGISMKLATDIHNVSGHCWKGFQGQRSKVKVTAGPNAIFDATV